ncbi:hypothetical protein OSTOST_12728 [Ostertagia ostertagi]
MTYSTTISSEFASLPERLKAELDFLSSGEGAVVALPPAKLERPMHYAFVAFQPEASLALPPLNESMNLVLTRKVIPSSVEALKELPAQAPYINPDISELEEALKELAALSKEVKDPASSETVSYFGDYRERTNSVDGAIKRQRKSVNYRVCTAF